MKGRASTNVISRPADSASRVMIVDEGDDGDGQRRQDVAQRPQQPARVAPGAQGVEHLVDHVRDRRLAGSRLSPWRSPRGRPAGRPAGPAGGGHDAGDGGEAEDHGERHDRERRTTPKPALAPSSPASGPSRGTCPGRGRRSVPNTATMTDSQRSAERSWRPRLADRPQEPELPRPLVDRQRQRVADAHHGDQDGDAEQAVDHVQHLVDLVADRVDVPSRVSGSGAPWAVGDGGDGGLAGGLGDAVGERRRTRRRRRPGRRRAASSRPCA